MSGCDVCIGSGDYDGFDWANTETRKARRPHTCCECHGSITPGQQYEHTTGGYYGDISRYKTCMMCVEIRNVFACGKSWLYECLWEDMKEYAFDRLTTASECFTKLSPAAKAFLLDRWRKWKGLHEHQ